MITPAYAPTATERVLPRLALDFTTATLDPRVTVTRALNTATVRNANGSISIVNADLPRFDYLNGVCRGLLIEEARSNVLTNSVFAGAVAGTPGTPPTNWLDLTATGTIASVSSGLYAAGNAIRITNSGTGRSFYRTQALSANTTYAYSLTVTVNSTPVAGYPRIRDCMNLFGGPAGSTVTYLLNGASATQNDAIPNGQTSTVVAIIAVAATAGNVEIRCGLGLGGAIDGDVTIQMPQFEAGAFATSYIPTTTTSLTRNADVVTMTGTNFSSWYNASEGTFMAEAIFNGATTANATPFALSGNLNNYSNWMAATRNGTSNVFSYNIITGGVGQSGFTNGLAVPNGQVCKAVLAYAVNNIGGSTNAAAATVDATASLPTLTRLLIGREQDNAVYLNGWARKFLYWPQRVLNAEAQAVSK